jgi:hypothetical protein
VGINHKIKIDMRKYMSYSLVADYGQVNEEFADYKNAYSSYCTQARYGHAATLYGRTIDGEMRVIFSRKEN